MIVTLAVVATVLLLASVEAAIVNYWDEGDVILAFATFVLAIICSAVLFVVTVVVTGLWVAALS